MLLFYLCLFNKLPEGPTEFLLPEILHSTSFSDSCIVRIAPGSPRGFSFVVKTQRNNQNLWHKCVFSDGTIIHFNLFPVKDFCWITAQRF